MRFVFCGLVQAMRLPRVDATAREPRSPRHGQWHCPHLATGHPGHRSTRPGPLVPAAPIKGSPLGNPEGPCRGGCCKPACIPRIATPARGECARVSPETVDRWPWWTIVPILPKGLRCWCHCCGGGSCHLGWLRGFLCTSFGTLGDGNLLNWFFYQNEVA